MPSPQYPLWWFPAFGCVAIAFWLLDSSFGMCVAPFAWATIGYGIGWHRAVRSIEFRIVKVGGEPDRTYPPDDCPYDHGLKKMLAVEPGLEVRCNACGILIGKGLDF